MFESVGEDTVALKFLQGCRDKGLRIRGRHVMKTCVYVACPYQGTATHDYHSYFTIHANIARAHEASLALARLGYIFFCPHTHSAHNEMIAPDLPASYWYELDLYFLRTCHAMLVLPGASKGVDREIASAVAWGIPVYTSFDVLVAEIPPRVEEMP